MKFFVFFLSLNLERVKRKILMWRVSIVVVSYAKVQAGVNFSANSRTINILPHFRLGKVSCFLFILEILVTDWRKVVHFKHHLKYIITKSTNKIIRRYCTWVCRTLSSICLICSFEKSSFSNGFFFRKNFAWCCHSRFQYCSVYYTRVSVRKTREFDQIKIWWDFRLGLL